MLYIFKSDTAVATVLPTQGDYGDIFTARFRAVGYTGDVKVFDVVAEKYPPVTPSSDDTILITGSKHNAWGDDPWVLKLVRYVSEVIGKTRIIGICFGHQIVARALDAPMGPSEKGWEVSGCEVTLTDRAKSLFPNLGTKPMFMQMHRDQVFKLPRDTELLGYTDICPIQGFYRAGELICVQFHPEFDQEIISAIAAIRFEGDFKENCIARSKLDNYGPKFNVDLLKFINGEL